MTNSIKKTLKVFLPITGREILNIEFFEKSLKTSNIFEAIKPMVNGFATWGIYNSSTRKWINYTEESFLDLLKDEFDKLEFVTELKIY